MYRILGTSILLVFVACTSRLYGQEKGWERGWFLREMQPIQAVEERPATAAEAKRIQSDIRRLAEVDAPDIGYSPTVNGHCFPPLPELDHWAVWTYARHKLSRSEALQALVESGPKALPFLLESLTDKTPTKLTIRLHHHKYEDGARVPLRQGLFPLTTIMVMQIPDGGMHAGREIAYNPLNRRETNALRKSGVRYDEKRSTQEPQLGGDPPCGHIKDYKYTLTVGDLCFVAIGQITNRRYWAARYQPMGNVVINSPAHDSKLADVVRSFWVTKDIRRSLLKSLVVDLHTRGGDWRGSAERLQIGAAIRLLYYFPAEASPLVAKRLRGLDVSSEAATDFETEESFKTNGVYADELIAAVNFSAHPEIRQELLDVFRRAAHSKYALAAVTTVPAERDSEVLAKLKLFLRALPDTEDQCHGDGYDLLNAVGRRFPDEVENILRAYVKKGGMQRRITLCRALREEWGTRWAVGFLTPLLRDKTKIHGWWDSAERNDSGAFPLRVCDEAALTIARHDSALSFKVDGCYEHLDCRIESMLKTLADKSAKRD